MFGMYVEVYGFVDFMTFCQWQCVPTTVCCLVTVS